MADAEIAARIVRLNGGRLVGKTRLQKSAYFLESLGVGFGLDFTYHHYGPYSEELEYLANDARALRLIEVDWQRSAEGVEYAIFQDRSSGLSTEPDDGRRRAIMMVLAQYTSTELELAATADFLGHNGYGEDAWEETARRKSSKISRDRVARAKYLLERLHAFQ
jgi:uncharacterized protein YwgA